MCWGGGAPGGGGVGGLREEKQESIWPHERPRGQLYHWHMLCLSDSYRCVCVCGGGHQLGGGGKGRGEGLREEKQESIWPHERPRGQLCHWYLLCSVG